jgi:hypothetical protein
MPAAPDRLVASLFQDPSFVFGVKLCPDVHPPRQLDAQSRLHSGAGAHCRHRRKILDAHRPVLPVVRLGCEVPAPTVPDVVSPPVGWVAGTPRSVAPIPLVIPGAVLGIALVPAPVPLAVVPAPVPPADWPVPDPVLLPLVLEPLLLPLVPDVPLPRSQPSTAVTPTVNAESINPLINF